MCSVVADALSVLFDVRLDRVEDAPPAAAARDGPAAVGLTGTVSLMFLHVDGMEATPVPVPPPCYRGVTVMFVASNRNLDTGRTTPGVRHME